MTEQQAVREALAIAERYEKALLKVHDALIEGDLGEAYHHLYAGLFASEPGMPTDADHTYLARSGLRTLTPEPEGEPKAKSAPKPAPKPSENGDIFAGVDKDIESALERLEAKKAKIIEAQERLREAREV